MRGGSGARIAAAGVVAGGSGDGRRRHHVDAAAPGACAAKWGTEWRHGARPRAGLRTGLGYGHDRSGLGFGLVLAGRHWDWACSGAAFGCGLWLREWFPAVLCRRLRALRRPPAAHTTICPNRRTCRGHGRHGCCVRAAQGQAGLLALPRAVTVTPLIPPASFWRPSRGQATAGSAVSSRRVGARRLGTAVVAGPRIACMHDWGDTVACCSGVPDISSEACPKHRPAFICPNLPWPTLAYSGLPFPAEQMHLCRYCCLALASPTVPPPLHPSHVPPLHPSHVPPLHSSHM